MKIRYALLLLILLITHEVLGQAFYDKNGTPTLYYNENKNAFFSYNGQPFFYLKRDFSNTDTHVYDFNGKHIGWYDQGKLYNNNGDIFLFTQTAGVIVILKLEPIKGIEQILPIKPIEELPPIKPFFSMNVVNLYIPNTSSQQQLSGTTYNVQPDYKSFEITPYQMPLKEMSNLIQQSNQKVQELINAGYVYYNNKWITREELTKIKKDENEKSSKQLADNLNNINNLIKNCSNSNLPEKIKNGWYKIVYADKYWGEIEVSAQFKKNRLKKIKFPDERLSAFTGLNIPYNNKSSFIRVWLFQFYPREGYLFYCFGFRK